MPQTIFRSGEGNAWACYLDDPSVISVRDGNLNLTVRKLPQSKPCAGQNGQMTTYVAGMVSTYRLFSQQYGRFEARFKNTATRSPGLQEAFWLWPDDRYNTASVAGGRRDRHRRDLLAVPRSGRPVPALHLVRQRGTATRSQHRLELRGASRRVQHVHARVDRQPPRDLRQREVVPGQHHRRPRVQEAVHRGADAAAGPRWQRVARPPLRCPRPCRSTTCTSGSSRPRSPSPDNEQPAVRWTAGNTKPLGRDR